MKIFIPYSFITLNQYINKERANKYLAATVKKDETYRASIYFMNIKLNTPIKIKFIWHMKNERTDPDNICWAKKMILDGMLKAGAIENDNFKHIKGFTDEFIVDKDNVGVMVEIEEM